MSRCFVYVGEKLFNKFGFVRDTDPNEFPLKKYCSITFNSLLVDGKKLPIRDVLICWSFALFIVDESIFYCGFSQSKVTCQPVELFFNESSVKDFKISGNYNHALLANEEHSFYIFCDEKFNPHSKNIPCVKEKLKQVIITESQSMFVYDGGSVYYCTNISSPILPLSFPQKILEVSCGKEHTLFLTLTGTVYSFGSGSRGQLGHGNIQDLEKPVLIEALAGLCFKNIMAGGWHSAAISECDDLYTWGWNESGQLGRPCKQLGHNSTEAEEICLLPKIVELGEDLSISAISFGSRHSAVLLGDCSVWTWGWNGYGQLGYDAQPCCDVPRCVTFPPGYTPLTIYCSPWGTMITCAIDSASTS